MACWFCFGMTRDTYPIRTYDIPLPATRTWRVNLVCRRSIATPSATFSLALRSVQTATLAVTKNDYVVRCSQGLLHVVWTALLLAQRVLHVAWCLTQDFPGVLVACLLTSCGVKVATMVGVDLSVTFG